MLKKKLNSGASFSRFLLHYRGPAPVISSATCSSSSSSYISSDQKPISHFFSSISYFCRVAIEEEERFPFTFSKFSSCGVFLQAQKINSGFSCQKSNLFCSSSSFTGKLQCWNCNSGPSTNKTPFLVCESCRSVQPVDHSIDYFQILGLEKKYDIEGESLDGKYKDWQKKLHPDLVHTKSQKEREYAAEQSARVTDAYRTLTNPLLRAKYIMQLQGVELDEEERITDPELLAEIMELREAVDEAAETQALHQIQAQIHGKLEHWSKSFADAFNNRKYDEALAFIRRMTYYKRAIEEITKKL